MSVFFNNRFDEARKFLKTLQIIPLKKEHVVRKTEEMSHADAPIKYVLDDILLLYMECIFEFYQEKKREKTNFPQNKTLFQELHEDAQVLINFGGQIQKKLNRADTLRRLLDFQSRMSSQDK